MKDAFGAGDAVDCVGLGRVCDDFGVVAIGRDTQRAKDVVVERDDQART